MCSLVTSIWEALATAPASHMGANPIGPSQYVRAVEIAWGPAAGAIHVATKPAGRAANCASLDRAAVLHTTIQSPLAFQFTFALAFAQFGRLARALARPFAHT